MTLDEIGARLPGLVGRFEITSNHDDVYNCIAWALNDKNQWWWPTNYFCPGVYWPPGVPKELTIPAFVRAFEEMLFTKCNSRDFEPGYDKIALYANVNGEPTHAARWWLEDGGWSSKLGEENDILHHTLDVLEGGDYGCVVQVMRRRRISTEIS
jgi:hypothetical protein